MISLIKYVLSTNSVVVVTIYLKSYMLTGKTDGLRCSSNNNSEGRLEQRMPIFGGSDWQGVRRKKKMIVTIITDLHP